MNPLVAAWSLGSLVAVVGCASSSSSISGKDGGGSVSCPISADGGVAPAGETVATGTVTGGDVDAVVCEADVTLYPASSTSPFNNGLLRLEVSGSARFGSPGNASSGMVQVNVGISAAAPGVYASSDGHECGTVTFSYNLPVPADVDCNDAPAGKCPSGCRGAATCGLCGPPAQACVPVVPSVSYEAQLPTDCLGGDNGTVAGSWTVTLTSVTPYVLDASVGTPYLTKYYLAHGSVEATLPGPQDGGTGSTTVSLKF